jgi:hypothetical protein
MITPEPLAGEQRRSGVAGVARGNLGSAAMSWAIIAQPEN